MFSRGRKKYCPRFLAKKLGLAGKTDEEEATADMIAEHGWSFLDRECACLFPADSGSIF